MSLGKNLQYLRKKTNITQEKLAERMGISRQTISKWEADEAYPEMDKLIALCELFSCKLDSLIREDMTCGADYYSPVRIETVKGFRLARYVMITPNPEDDVQAYMKRWAERSGLTNTGTELKMIGWDFPFVSYEQQQRFNLRGYVAGYVLPEGFEPACEGAELFSQGDETYAIVTIREPFIAPFERIPGAYKLIIAHLNANGFKENTKSNAIACYEWEYEKDGISYMDVHILVDAVSKGNLHAFMG
ncbi:MAG: helix-turn-helix transcriptional regulator [Clostridiales bacterium]|nr:helix-turn-helix transcriptional regulator [Clostridiales bacterium]